MSRTLPALLALACLLSAAAAPADELAGGPPRATRVVSMNPSLSAMLLALGAASVVVGVEEHSARRYPELADVPVVGGLFNPSLEAVVAVRPDLVVLVPSAEQRDFRRRVEALGIEVLALPNLTVAEIADSLEVLGARVGRLPQARARAAAIRSRFEAAAAAPRGDAPRAVVVLQRDPLFVAGAASFLDEMLRAAGGVNAAAALDEAYPRVGVEWLIAAAPEVILDASNDPTAAAEYWRRWPSLPAVAQGRVLALPRSVTFPGPYVDRSLAELEALLHVEPRGAAPPAGAPARAGAP
jgi:iron complex transport system substrate-binding protein